MLASGSILIICTLAWTARQGVPGFVGDHGQGVTPVPISNTEVKPLSPMILLSGKVGYRRLYGPPQVIPGEALFIFGYLFFGGGAWIVGLGRRRSGVIRST